ncbi:acetamidase/formamidase family protein [uncultured Bilophila sp.]|uniref:acetamidase/formamidase family protein n=1 Tax=uncultured Bilophila sp. TaxID=529385 RepID=UPI00280B4D82|nr:acetamidase/formamidase family protein [uncultured Bilophila sp.]
MRITREHHVYSLGVSEPVATVAAPCSLTVETCDCFNGQVTEDGQSMARLNFSHVNPATGPVVVEGAEPGDVLRVHIRAIRPAEVGALMTAPGAGALPDRVKGDTRICPISNGHFTFKGVELPLNPMIGVIGVAPAGEAVPCGTPGDHGGNMDTVGIREGAILRLPVFVKGAYFGLGDLHAAMGDGEVSVTGLEVSGEVDLDLSLEKGASLPCPLLHDGGEVSFLASAETVDEAILVSTGYMHDFLLAKASLNADEALMLMSLCGHARISQIVDPLKTARFAMPVSVLAKFGVAVE